MTRFEPAMTRFESVSPELRTLVFVLAGLVASVLWAALAMAIALTGLHRWTLHLDVAQAPAWFWWFRGDPEVGRWLKVGALGSSLAVLFAASGRP